MSLWKREIIYRIADCIYPQPLKDVRLVIWFSVCTDYVEIRKKDEYVCDLADDEKYGDLINECKSWASFINA